MAAVRPPSWIMKESALAPFRTLRDPIIYVDTKFGEDILNILIAGGDIPPKRNSKNVPWLRISTSGSNFPQSCNDLRMCHRAKVQPNKTIGYRVTSILPFYPLRKFWAAFFLPLWRRSAPSSKTTFRGPQECLPQTASWSVYPFLHSEAELSRVTDRQTDRRREHR